MSTFVINITSVCRLCHGATCILLQKKEMNHCWWAVYFFFSSHFERIRCVYFYHLLDRLKISITQLNCFECKIECIFNMKFCGIYNIWPLQAIIINHFVCVDVMRWYPPPFGINKAWMELLRATVPAKVSGDWIKSKSKTFRRPHSRTQVLCSNHQICSHKHAHTHTQLEFYTRRQPIELPKKEIVKKFTCNVTAHWASVWFEIFDLKIGQNQKATIHL